MFTANLLKTQICSCFCRFVYRNTVIQQHLAQHLPAATVFDTSSTTCASYLVRHLQCTLSIHQEQHRVTVYISVLWDEQTEAVYCLTGVKLLIFLCCVHVKKAGCTAISWKHPCRNGSSYMCIF